MWEANGPHEASRQGRAVRPSCFAVSAVGPARVGDPASAGTMTDMADHSVLIWSDYI